MVIKNQKRIESNFSIVYKSWILIVSPRIPIGDGVSLFLEYNSKDISKYLGPTPLAT